MDNFCLTIFKFITQLFKLRVTLTLRGGSRRHEHGEGLGVDTGRGQSFHHFVGHEHPEVQLLVLGFGNCQLVFEIAWQFE